MSGASLESNVDPSEESERQQELAESESTPFIMAHLYSQSPIASEIGRPDVAEHSNSAPPIDSAAPSTTGGGSAGSTRLGTRRAVSV